jgi:hypothetical protein
MLALTQPPASTDPRSGCQTVHGLHVRDTTHSLFVHSCAMPITASKVDLPQTRPPDAGIMIHGDLALVLCLQHVCGMLAAWMQYACSTPAVRW